jgi:hypothetical protein
MKSISQKKVPTKSFQGKPTLIFISLLLNADENIQTVDMDMYLSPPTADINAELKTNV